MFDGHAWCPAAGWTVRRARILIIIAAGSSGPRGSGGRRGHRPREWRLHTGFLCLGCRRFDFFSSSREEESFHKLTQLSKRRSVDPCFSERDSRHAGSRGRAFARSRSRGHGQRPRPGYRCCPRGVTLSVCKRAFPGANGVPRADLPELSRARAAFRGVRLPSQAFRGAARGPRRVLCFSKRVAPTGRARSSWASGPGGSDRGPGMISAS